MNDFRDLKAIAEVCKQHQPLRFMRSHGALYIRNDNGIVFDVHQNRSFPKAMSENKDYADLVLAASPAAILALISENDRLSGLQPSFPPRPPDGEGLPRFGLRWNGPQQPLAVAMADGYWTPWHLADQLRAEVAGLKTGYEAYEQVVQDLKAEVEALRKDADRLEKATAFVQQLCDAAGKQPSVATGYLHDILSAMSKEG